MYARIDVDHLAMSLWRELSDLTAPEAVVADLEDDDYIDSRFPIS